MRCIARALIVVLMASLGIVGCAGVSGEYAASGRNVQPIAPDPPTLR